MRHNLKVKSQLKEVCSRQQKTPTPVKKFRVLSEVPRTDSKSEEEIKNHLTKLKEEWKKLQRNRDAGHIKMLLRETLEYRDEFLKSHPNSLLKDVIEEFPCFSDAVYVS